MVDMLKLEKLQSRSMAPELLCKETGSDSLGPKP